MPGDKQLWTTSYSETIPPHCPYSSIPNHMYLGGPYKNCLLGHRGHPLNGMPLGAWGW